MPSPSGTPLTWSRPARWNTTPPTAAPTSASRSTTIDPYGPEGQAKIHQLLRGADLFYANRRPG
ncbi:hypothetical protein [Streptomyces sp. NPDC057582]|uniref:hypothetical protein n=1 Tax=Streptomyces sp. NPDC057582 TaxID=3346174 RepID=UPI003676B258